MIAVAWAHFGPGGLGSDLSPQAHDVVDKVTWVLIVIATMMLVQLVWKTIRNKKGISNREEV